MIEKVRKNLPDGFRKKLKEMTAKHPLLTFFIALSYGFLLKPYWNPCIIGKGIPKMFVIPDIYAVDCATDIFIKRVYERFYEIQNGAVVVDVGANVGMFAVKASMDVGTLGGKVIAVEPAEENFRLLEKNVTLQHLKNVVLYREALGCKKEKAILVKSLLCATHQLKHVSKISEFAEDEIVVDVELLDTICKDQNISKIDLLKIDTEGSELDVLRGGVNCLKFTKHIAMELHYDGEDEKVKKFLEGRGFAVHVIGNLLYAENASILLQ